MSRLDFRSSDDAARWRTALHAAGDVWREAEVASVAAGLRKVCLTDVDSERIAVEWRAAERRGLVLLPLTALVAPNAPFSHAITSTVVDPAAVLAKAMAVNEAPPGLSDVRQHEACTYRVALARDAADARALHAALMAGNTGDVAQLLGYPACCATWFARLWREGIADPAWTMVTASDDPGVDRSGLPSTIRLSGIGWPALNPTLRYVGIRLVPHIPHSLTCEASRAMALAWQDALVTDQNRAGFAMLNRALALPMTSRLSPSGLAVSTDHFHFVVPASPRT